MPDSPRESESDPPSPIVPEDTMTASVGGKDEADRRLQETNTDIKGRTSKPNRICRIDQQVYEITGTNPIDWTSNFC
jgi:hypothetical protein